MSDDIDWVHSLDRITTVFARIYLHHRSRERQANAEQQKVLRQKLKREVGFTLRRLADAEFGALIEGRLDYTREGSKKRGIVAERNMKTLVTFILEDIAAKRRGKWATANKLIPHSRNAELAPDPPGNDTDRVDLSYSRFHELLEEFPELLYTHDELQKAFDGRKFAAGRRMDDRRERVIATPHSSPQNISNEIFLAFFALVKDRWSGEEVRDYLYRAVTQMTDNDRIQIIDPAAIRKRRLLEAFVGVELSRLNLFPTFSKGTKETKRKRFVHFVADLLYTQVRILVELHWFRGISVYKQDQLLSRQPRRLKEISQRRALVCVNEARGWLGSDHDVFVVANHAFDSLLAMDHAVSAERLLKSVLTGLNLPLDDRANALHSLAMVYRVLQKPEQEQALEQSVKLWQEIGGHPGDQAVEYAYLAQIHRLEGDFSDYRTLRAKAEELASSEQLTLRRRTHLILYLADSAEISKDMSWELSLLEKGLSLSAKDRGLLNYFEYFDQSIRDIKTRGSRGPEWGDGRVPRPPEIRTEPMSGVFEVAFDDPSFGN